MNVANKIAHSQQISYEQLMNIQDYEKDELEYDLLELEYDL